MRSIQKYFPVLLLGLLLFIGWQQHWWKATYPRLARNNPALPTAMAPNRDVGNEAINRQAHLEFTRHAICRMECRQVSREEVADILARGKVNVEKSNPADHPCPTYALEGYSQGQHLRIVFAFCDAKNAKVVTCIDMDKEWNCNCD